MKLEMDVALEEAQKVIKFSDDWDAEDIQLFALRYIVANSIDVNEHFSDDDVVDDNDRSNGPRK